MKTAIFIAFGAATLALLFVRGSAQGSAGGIAPLASAPDPRYARAAAARQDGLCEPLKPFFTTTLSGDYVARGCGLRETGSCMITIPALPINSVVEKAFIVWAIISNEIEPCPNLYFNGHELLGSLSGTCDHQPCWGRTHTYVFTADVTQWVAGAGTYSLSGAPAPVGNALSEGASLVVVYSAQALPFRFVSLSVGDLVIDQFDQTVSSTIPVSPVCALEGKTTFIVADGQPFFDDTENFNSATFKNAADGSDGLLWDTDTFQVGSFLTLGETSIDVGLTGLGDCLVHVAQVFSTPVCGSELSQCCSFALSQVQQLAFVASSTLSGTCSLIENLFSSSELCYSSAIEQVCDLLVPHPPSPCSATLANYLNDVASVLAGLQASCDAETAAIHALEVLYLQNITNHCVEDSVGDIVREFGERLQGLILAVDVSTASNEMTTISVDALNQACAVGPNEELCPAYEGLCGPGLDNLEDTSEQELVFASDIVGQQIEVSESGIPLYCAV